MISIMKTLDILKIKRIITHATTCKTQMNMMVKDITVALIWVLMIMKTICLI